MSTPMRRIRSPCCARAESDTTDSVMSPNYCRPRSVEGVHATSGLLAPPTECVQRTRRRGTQGKEIASNEILSQIAVDACCRAAKFNLTLVRTIIAPGLEPSSPVPAAPEPGLLGVLGSTRRDG
jgi:hypothetical protein